MEQPVILQNYLLMLVGRQISQKSKREELREDLIIFIATYSLFLPYCLKTQM